MSQEDLRALTDRVRAMGPMPYSTTPDLSRPLVQLPMGGGSLGAPDLSQEGYRRHLATALYRSQADVPSYEQWVQQRSAMQNPMNTLAGFPPKPGIFGPQVQPDRRILPMPPRMDPRQMRDYQKDMRKGDMSPRPGLGLAGLAGMLRGRERD
jgi:hypothetical protein